MNWLKRHWKKIVVPVCGVATALWGDKVPLLREVCGAIASSPESGSSFVGGALTTLMFTPGAKKAE